METSTVVVSKCTVIWKVYSGRIFPAKSFQKFPENRNKFPEISRNFLYGISGLTTLGTSNKQVLTYFHTLHTTLLEPHCGYFQWWI